MTTALFENAFKMRTNKKCNYNIIFIITIVIWCCQTVDTSSSSSIFANRFCFLVVARDFSMLRPTTIRVV